MTHLVSISDLTFGPQNDNGNRYAYFPISKYHEGIVVKWMSDPLETYGLNLGMANLTRTQVDMILLTLSLSPADLQRFAPLAASFTGK